MDLILYVLFAVWLYYFVKLYNGYKVELHIGKKGSGKSTNITKKLLYYHRHPYNVYYDSELDRWVKKRWHIYTNFDVSMPFAVEKFSTKDLGSFHPQSPAIIFIDEVNLFWDNRKFKEFSESTQEFFRTNRKNRCKMYLYSQTFDCDKKIRDLTDLMWLDVNFLGIFSLSKKISKVVDIADNAITADSQVVDRLKFVPFFIPGARRITFIPRYIKYHKSYSPTSNRKILITTSTEIRQPTKHLTGFRERFMSLLHVLVKNEETADPEQETLV